MKTITENIKEKIKELESEDLYLNYMQDKEEAIVLAKYEAKREGNFKMRMFLGSLLRAYEE